VITAPLFVATKLEAFRGRGNQDYLASHDLEDQITVVASRPELLDEIQQSDDTLRRSIAAAIQTLLDDNDFLAALAGQLPADAASQARLPELLRRLRSLAQ
jgi:hypothetical protein